MVHWDFGWRVFFHCLLSFPLLCLLLQGTQACHLLRLISGIRSLAAFYGIRWAHNLHGFHNPCQSILVEGVLESAKRSLSKPVVEKEPAISDAILVICEKFACVKANLSDLGAAAICVTAYAGFSL